jgi:hypothetical protein
MKMIDMRLALCAAPLLVMVACVDNLPEQGAQDPASATSESSGSGNDQRAEAADPLSNEMSVTKPDSTGEETTPLSGDATTNSATCRILGDINPRTFVSVSCKKSNILSRAEAYAAFVRCVDHRINVEYTHIGDIFVTPALGGFGPTSTASCDAGDQAIESGRT